MADASQRARLPGRIQRNNPASAVTSEQGHMYDLSEKTTDRRVQALFDPWTFIDLLDFKGGRKSFSNIHQELLTFSTAPQLSQKEQKRRLGLVPRGHLKSTLGTVLYCLWRIYRNPNIRIAVLTATKELALQFIREMKQYLEDSDLQKEVWNKRPHHPGKNLCPVLDMAGRSRRQYLRELGDYTEAEDKKVVWRSDSLQVNRPKVMKEPTLLASSVGSSITGMHFDLMILDDVVNEDNIATPDLQSKLITWAQDLEFIVDPPRIEEMGVLPSDRHDGTELTEELGDEIQIWGTRYAIGDYYDYLLANLKEHEYYLFFRSIYKNGKNSEEGYIWPEKFSNDYVEKLRKRAGNIRFASQYLNVVIASEDIVFHSDRLQNISPAALILDQAPNIKIRIGEETKDVQLWCVVDPAISLKKKADYSVVMVGGQDAEQNLYILDYVCDRLEPNNLVKETYRLMDKYKLSVLGLEVAAMQKTIVYTFRDKFREYRPISIKEIVPEGEKKGRIRNRIEPLVSNSMLYVMPWMKNHKELQDELLYFPSDTVHDDILDAMAMLVFMSKPTLQKSRNKRNAISNFSRNPMYGGRLR